MFSSRRIAIAMAANILTYYMSAAPILRSAAVSLALLYTMSACSDQRGTAVLGEILAVEDDEASPSTAPGEKAETQLRPAKTISSGEHLQVTRGKVVTICFLPGVMAAASDSAEIEVEDLRIRKDGNETDEAIKSREVRLRLDLGSLTVSLDSKNIAVLPYLSIATAAGTLSADFDALFYIKSDPHHTEVVCIRGEIDLHDNNARNLATLRTGQWCDWKKGEVPQLQRVTSSQTQKEVAAAREAEKKMATLFMTKQHPGPP